MSRIGQKEIVKPENVDLSILSESENKDYYTVKVSGPLGSLSLDVHRDIIVDVEGNIIKVKPKVIDKKTKSLWGLYRTLINNMVLGVVNYFSKELEIVGIGYRAEMKGKDLVMSVGYSHKIHYTPPEGVFVDLIDANNIKVYGSDKQKVGEVAAKIRSFRKPEPYKGKGIRYKNEQVRRKSTKSA